MSLTTRLSMFFLAALALVLAAFSLTFHLLAKDYLNEQIKERLTSALDTLEAAVDHEPNGLDWEPHERKVMIGHDSDPTIVRWEVLDKNGRRVDRSPNLQDKKASLTNGEMLQTEVGMQIINRDQQKWQVVWRRVNFRLPEKTEAPRHTQLFLTAGMSLLPIQATLWRMDLLLIGISGAIWLTAAAAGHWACKRALLPLRHMAGAAKLISAANLSQRLQEPVPNDELGVLQKSFNELLARLQDTFERQRRFTGDASHQLRTPLTALLGQVEVALRRERPIDEYQFVLEMVRTQAEHLRRIVEALLFLARTDVDGDLQHTEAVDLATWLPVHLERWKNQPRSADLAFEGPQSAIVRAQPVLLAQLIDNLLDNAFKYSDPGTPVKITLVNEPAGIRVTTHDAGQGIEPADMPHIFEAFYRALEARRQGKSGVGLGLSIAQRIAIAFGGEITVESEIGKGSCFTVRLPLFNTVS